VFSCTLNAAAVQHPDMHNMVATERECLTIVTSQGQMLVLSANRLEQLGMLSAEGDDAAESDADATPESALLSSHQLSSEPRLTAMVAWNPAAAATYAGKLQPRFLCTRYVAAKGNKRARPMMENESGSASGGKSAAMEQEQRQESESEEEGDAEAARKEKKRLAKKAKREAARGVQVPAAPVAVEAVKAAPQQQKAAKEGKKVAAAATVAVDGENKKKGLISSAPAAGKKVKKQGK
jgi:hypothetical protein